jgi:diguanylate cyclase (GGDEF)-like protein
MFGSSAPLLIEKNGSEIFLQHMRATVDTALQPITDIRSGMVHGFEALVRNTPSLGLPSIADFFAFADRLDVKIEVDRFLYATAAAKLASLEHGTDALLFLNLDRQRAATLGETLPALLESIGRSSLSPSDVCIEITEGGDASDCDDLANAVETLRRSGFRLAIDDFGTGLSGLQALYEWQPEYVKIDRFFISGLERDGRKRLFVSRVVELAHILGTKVVAEGVEHVEELHACRDAGCDLVQGYFIARPTCDMAAIKRVYATVAENPDRRMAPRSAPTLEDDGVVTPIEPIADSTRLAAIVEHFLSHPECSFLPVVDARSMPIGIIRERDLRALVQSSVGRDLLKNASCPLNVRDFVVRLPVVDANICSTRVIEQCAQSISEGLIVTKEMRYAGFVSSSALLHLASMIRLRQAQSQNPLTHLPANDAILDFIGCACSERNAPHAFCHLDFNHFKPFNDVYGFHVGDRAIMMFAELLRSEFGRDNVFLGHIGGDDFFVGCSGRTHGLSARLKKVQDRFALDAESLYAPEHRLSGFIECAGRDGVVSRFPLLSCSVALLIVPAGGRSTMTDEIAQELARLKATAKKSPSSFSSATLTAGIGNLESADVQNASAAG